MATIYDCTNTTNKDVYDEIKKYYAEAYQCIDKALKLDEDGKTDEAIAMYEFSLTLIDQALNQNIESPTQPDIEWEKVYSMIQKMRKSKKEILSRISDAQTREHPAAAIPPPSYEEAMAAGPSGFTAPPLSSPTATTPYIPESARFDANLHSNQQAPGYADLSAELNEMRIAANREVIYSHNNVRIYFIAPDGRVSATSEPDTLIIGRIEELTNEDVLDETLLDIVDQLSAEGSGDKKHRRHRHGHHHRRHRHHRHGESSQSIRTVPEGHGQIYLQVGSWVYPLIPGISPVFRSDYGAFIFPDVHSEVEGAAVGLILPANADKSVFEILNSILLTVVGVQDLPPKGPPTAPARLRRSDRADRKSENAFANNVVRGASYLANNLVRGAGSASRLLDAAAPRIMTKINPATEPQAINPTLKTTVSVAKTVSEKAATVSDYLASKVGSAASALGEYLAPHVQRGGTKLLTSTTNMTPQQASSRVESFMGVTSGAVQGIATVYSGLETSAGILGRSLANNTVQIIEYKYGKPVGAVAGDAASTAGNVYNIHSNYKFMKPTKIAKTVAKSAVKTAIHEGPHGEFQGTGPGDGGGFAPLAAPPNTDLNTNNPNPTLPQVPQNLPNKSEKK